MQIIASKQCARAMVHLAEFAPSLRTLGSYPRWRERDDPAEAGRAQEGARRG
jgi:hypothetical protein